VTPHPSECALRPSAARAVPSPALCAYAVAKAAAGDAETSRGEARSQTTCLHCRTFQPHRVLWGWAPAPQRHATWACAPRAAENGPTPVQAARGDTRACEQAQPHQPALPSVAPHASRCAQRPLMPRPLAPLRSQSPQRGPAQLSVSMFLSEIEIFGHRSLFPQIFGFFSGTKTGKQPTTRGCSQFDKNNISRITSWTWQVKHNC
jgi:hypothetical protein